MIVILGALIFAALTGGLSLLMAIPLLFVILGVAVFKEGHQIAKAAKEAPAQPLPAAEPERPRTMVAGRRA